jgi:hypothetical protein
MIPYVNFESAQPEIGMEMFYDPPRYSSGYAALFQTMSPEFAAGFLGRMQPTSAADILTGLKPDKAYEVSVLLAGRNALVPKN